MQKSFVISRLFVQKTGRSIKTGLIQRQCLWFNISAHNQKEYQTSDIVKYFTNIELSEIFIEPCSLIAIHSVDKVNQPDAFHKKRFALKVVHTLSCSVLAASSKELPSKCRHMKIFLRSIYMQSKWNSGKRQNGFSLFNEKKELDLY